MPQNKSLMIQASVERSILLLRGHKVLLDSSLAELYGVETRALIQAIRRNRLRFPSDFFFQLTFQELAGLRSQIVISNDTTARGGRRYLPYAFTEHGTIMAAMILKTPRAVQASVAVVRAFVQLRRMLSTHQELARKLDELERGIATHDKAIRSLFEAIRQLMAPPLESRRKIGFDLSPCQKPEEQGPGEGRKR